MVASLAAVAVPESTPVDELNVRPAGRAGAIEKKGVLRPVAVNAVVAVMAAPTRPVTVWVLGESVAVPETAMVIVAVAEVVPSETVTV